MIQPIPCMRAALFGCLIAAALIMSPERSLGQCAALDRPEPPAELTLERVFPALSFSAPVNLLQAPGESGRWYVAEQTGRIRVFDEGDTAAGTFLNFTDRVTTYGVEQGLLDMAFHPDYPDTPFVYLSYTNTSGDSVLSRLRAAADGYRAFPESEVVLLSVPQPYANHNGGQLAFGPVDGYLYWSLGDGGSGGDPENNGQDPHTLPGSILRLDVDGGTPYAIPRDNPFYGSPCGQGGGCPEIYAWGLRNPWRFSFDVHSEDQRLFAGDVGQSEWEEVNLIRKGKNYGWHCYEGTHPYDTTDCSGTYTPPIHEYAHTDGRCSVTGGHVYRGSLSGWVGQYIFGDYCTGEIWGLSEDSGYWTENRLADTDISLAAFGRGNSGEVYALDLAGGGIYQLVPTQDNGGGFPQLLSDTGYFRAGGPPVEPLDCFIPYSVNSPLWSDGAEKHRFVWAPQGSVAIGPDGDFFFPAGTVFIKEFRLNGVPIETRLFMRHADGGWAGYTYNWRPDGTDAELLTGRATETIFGQEWVFPSPNGCLRCHTEAAGRALGPEVGQLNARFDYGGSIGAVNQLSRWEAEGLFSEPLPADPENLTAFAGPSDLDLPVSARSRAYLHSNCANCHRPGGMARGSADLRHGQKLWEMAVCSVEPTLGDLGISGARLLAPGAPERSVLLGRMILRDEYQMPPLASRQADPLGTGLIETWIAQIVSCSPVVAPQMLLLTDD